MRTLHVVFLSEPVKSLLLLLEILRRRTGRLCLQRPMHPLVPAVLLWLASLNALMHDPQLHPPDRQPRQPADRGAAERASIIRSDRLGKTHLGKDSLESLLCS